MASVQRAQFRFFHRLRVRWAEVDMQKIVFNPHYLMYFDTAMSEYWRALALPYDATMQALQGEMFVKKAAIEFHASARLDDALDVALQCSRIGTSSLTFSAAIFRGQEHLISCELIYVFADPLKQTPKPVPDALRAIMLGYEAGEPVLQVRVDSWAVLQAHAAEVRSAVFLLEQKITVEEEWDAADATAMHAVVCNRLGLPVATGRLLQPAGGEGRIGRMAVHRVLRGTGVGRTVLQALMAAARKRNDRRVLLHAQRSAEGFYARLGFAAVGEAFDEVGIEHITMLHTFSEPS